MKLAIVFLLFSIIVFSDAFAIEEADENAEKIAQRQIALLNIAITSGEKALIRELIDVQPDTDDNVNEILSEYRYAKLDVKIAELIRPNLLLSVVVLQPKLIDGHRKWRVFEMMKYPSSLTGWKIVTH